MMELIVLGSKYKAEVEKRKTKYDRNKQILGLTKDILGSRVC
jgi:hypothetical protein